MLKAAIGFLFLIAEYLTSLYCSFTQVLICSVANTSLKVYYTTFHTLNDKRNLHFLRHLVLKDSSGTRDGFIPSPLALFKMEEKREMYWSHITQLTELKKYPSHKQFISVWHFQTLIFQPPGLKRSVHDGWEQYIVLMRHSPWEFQALWIQQDGENHPKPPW